MSFTYLYPRPCVTTDIAVIRKNNGALELLLIKRKNQPFKDAWALPGGFLDENETLEECAARELEEETSIKGLTLTQFRAYSAINRDPRQRTITVVFVGILNTEQHEKAGDDAADVQWFKIEELPTLAFDHQQIIDDILEELSQG